MEFFLVYFASDRWYKSHFNDHYLLINLYILLDLWFLFKIGV